MIVATWSANGLLRKEIELVFGVRSNVAAQDVTNCFDAVFHDL